MNVRSGVSLVEPSIPQNPAAGNVIVYKKPDGRMYSKNCTGKEALLTDEASKLLEQAFRFDNGI